MQKLRPQRPEPRPHEAAPTTALRVPDVPDAKAPERPAVSPPVVPQPQRPDHDEPRPHEAAPTTALPLPDVPEPPAPKPPTPEPQEPAAEAQEPAAAEPAAPEPQEPAAVEPAEPEATASHPAIERAPLEARQVRLSVDGEQVLADLSFTAKPGTLTAVIGHSEATTAALVDVLGGAVQPSVGTVHFDGHDVADDHQRAHIGVVPRYDLLHPALTVEQALRYAAELRLPSKTSADHRRQSVHRALSEMKLESLRTIQVGHLTAEQRKRASMAMELLTEPSLLVLDEPTAGLDAAAHTEMRTTLRRLADEGRVVVAATTSPTDIDMYDQIVLLTATGTPAFAGPPAQIGAELGTTDWEAILARVNSDPYGAHGAYLARQPETTAAPPPQTSAEAPAEKSHRSLWRQILVAVRRQAWLLAGAQRYSIFVAILPMLFGGISLLVPGNAGLGPADPYGSSPDEALEILAVLTMGAVVIGTALGIRDLFCEQRIFRREQANGLSASAYLAGKVIVYSVVAVLAAAIMTTAAVVGKGAPTNGAVLLGDTAFGAAVELFVILAITTIVSTMVALALSSWASYVEQVVLVAVLIVLVSAVFTGAMFPIAGRFGLEQVSWIVPSRWGLAAAASTVDVPAVNLLAAADDSWTHSSGRWLFDLAMLIGLGVVATGWLRWRLRRPARRRDQAKVTVAQANSQS
jgi:ABC transport system ATP-binding/permease protein